MERIAKLKSLTDVYLMDTKVTEEGVRKLQSALPKAKITLKGSFRLGKTRR